MYHAKANISVLCFSDAFADILHHCDLAIGMAGTAVEQMVGLGKPVIQIMGNGPQFSYRFANAQERLLGLSVQTIGKEPATPKILQEAAQCVKRTLSDRDYLERCKQNGMERVGAKGGSERLADAIAQIFKSIPSRDFKDFSGKKVVFNADCDRLTALEVFRLLFCYASLFLRSRLKQDIIKINSVILRKIVVLSRKFLYNCHN
jgi:hypothetical protein